MKWMIHIVVVAFIAAAAVWIIRYPDSQPISSPVGAESSGDHMPDAQVQSIHTERDQLHTFISNDKQFSFSYPSNWNTLDTTPTESESFGTFIQTWVVQSFLPDRYGSGGIPENTVKIDFDISTDSGVTLDSVVRCDGKVIVCEDVTISNVTYRKSSAQLNSGMYHTVIATKRENRIYRASAFIQSGGDQDKNRKIVDQIFQSFTLHERE